MTQNQYGSQRQGGAGANLGATSAQTGPLSKRAQDGGQAGASLIEHDNPDDVETRPQSTNPDIKRS